MSIPAPGMTPARLRILPSWLVTHTATISRRTIAEALANAGARESHYLILAMLEEFGPASPAGLERDTRIHLSDILATLGTLQRKKYVKRTPAPLDRRSTIVTITPAGTRQLRSLDRLLSQAQADLFAALSAEERDQLVRLLTKTLTCHR